MNIKSPYTYFETKSGLIGYSYGYDARINDKKMTCGFVGYFSNVPGDRIQISTGRYVEKVLWHGNEGNWKFDEHFANLPKNITSGFKKFTFVSRMTGERLVSIPGKEILLTYDSSTALKKLRSGEWFFSNKHQDALNKIIEVLLKAGIPFDDIGLYGSAQMGIFSPSKTVDIDILLYGLDKYDVLEKIVATRAHMKIAASKYQSVNEIENWRLARMKRSQASTIYLDSTTHADIKIVRKPNDQLLFNFQNISVSRDDIEITGEVTNATESLSVPTVFEIQNHNGKYIVGTRKYVYIGAARLGDKVIVRGRQVNNSNTILLADPIKHFIKCVN